MALRFACNCSRGLRILTWAVLVLSFSASFSSSEAGYCDTSFDVRAARIRWANARQSEPNSEDPGRACRAYGNQFYEAVEARQAVFDCKLGAERQKDIEILDSEIEAFNNLIAARCGT